MRKFKLCAVAIACFMTGMLTAQEVNRTERGIVLEMPDGTSHEVMFYSPSIVRIVKHPAITSCLPKMESLSVIMKPDDIRFTINDDGERVKLSTSEICVQVGKQTGNVNFLTAQGLPLVREKSGALMERHRTGANLGGYRVRQGFVLDKEEAIYGLGQLQNGKMSQRGEKKYLIQTNTEDVVTFIQSVKGYGLYWDNYSPTTFEDNEQEMSFDSEVGDCVDYYFMYGGNADGVVAAMRDLTGQVPMFPLWTYGFAQSKERYKSQDELVGVVRRYREIGVPLDCIIQDWQYWGSNYLWNAMDFLNETFPDPKRMMDDIHGMNAKAMISIWPSFGPMTKPYLEMDKKGLMFDFSTWPESGIQGWPPRMDYPSHVKMYNAYNKDARDIYWKYLNAGIFSVGMDGWWMDGTEPDHFNQQSRDYDLETGMGTFRRVRNAFPLMTVGGVYDNQRATTSDKRVFIMTRSVFAGQQRYGCNIWTGDVQATWDNFRRQITAGLNLSLCGIPHWNTDIGGFFIWTFPKRLEDPDCKELHVRWQQFATFCPMMRSHGEGGAREIWELGSKGTPYYDAYEKFIHLRYSLLPYIYSTSWEVTHRQSSFIRALMMDFASDKKVHDIGDEYMFGKAFLACPVIESMYTRKAEDTHVADFSTVKSRSVYLPAGTTWYDFWTNEYLDGGQTVKREAPIDIMPLYVRAGSIIPFGPRVQYTTEKPWNNLDVTVYPGADGSFTLYEDEFDNYNYEKGAYTEIPMNWNEKSHTLTIGERKGSYKGMIGERVFNVKLVDGTSKEVKYSGKKVTVKL